MTRPLLIDLFCGAGGAAMGYHRAGFDVIGIDLHPQPHYPFPFIRADALRPPLDLALADLIHASPPCQFATAYRRRPGVALTARSLIHQTRAVLVGSGRPYVIENVDQAGARGELRHPVRLCGSSFRLDVRRHRLFETSWPAWSVPCDHGWQTPRFPPATNRTNLRSTVEVGVWRIPLATQCRAMGIDWMTLTELSEAIPPAYAEHIGRAFLTASHA
jgi:DNA (cytosine-5)-methyltransferase 1